MCLVLLIDFLLVLCHVLLPFSMPSNFLRNTAGHCECYIVKCLYIAVFSLKSVEMSGGQIVELLKNNLNPLFLCFVGWV